MRVKAVNYCALCKRPFHPWAGQRIAKFCSRKCNCRAKLTPEFQSRAGKAGGAHKIKLRGTGTIGYVKEYGRHQHRIVVEKMLGRKLKKGEIVHHIDGDKHNNASSNLKVTTQSKHIKIHGVCHHGK